MYIYISPNTFPVTHCKHRRPLGRGMLCECNFYIGDLDFRADLIIVLLIYIIYNNYILYLSIPYGGPGIFRIFKNRDVSGADVTSFAAGLTHCKNEHTKLI